MAAFIPPKLFSKLSSDSQKIITRAGSTPGKGWLVQPGIEGGSKFTSEKKAPDDPRFYKIDPSNKELYYRSVNDKKYYQDIPAGKCLSKEDKQKLIEAGKCYLKQYDNAEHVIYGYNNLGELKADTITDVLLKDQFNPCKMILDIPTCNCPINTIYDPNKQTCYDPTAVIKTEPPKTEPPKKTQTLPDNYKIPDDVIPFNENQVIEEKEKADNTLMIGGILAAVVIGGGLMYYLSTKKKDNDYER